MSNREKHVYLPTELHQRLKIAAAQNNTTIAGEVETAVIAHLKRHIKRRGEQ